MNLRAIFKRQILVARVSGIPVRIDYTWFIVFAMSVALIAANVRKYPLQLGTFIIPPTGAARGHLETEREYSRRHPDRRLLRPVDVARADRLWNLHGSGADFPRLLYGIVVGAGRRVFVGRGHQRRSQHARLSNGGPGDVA